MPALAKAYALENGIGFGVVEVDEEGAGTMTVGDVEMVASLARSRGQVALLRRANGWHVATFRPAEVSAAEVWSHAHVILGGSGRVGRDMCRYLLRNRSAPVVAVARFRDLDLEPGRVYRCGDLPSRALEAFFQGDVPENAGQRFFVASVDVTNSVAVKDFLGRALRPVCDDFSLIYCVGQAHESIVRVQEMAHETVSHVLNAKLQGIVNVAEALPDVPAVKRCVVLSSLSSELSGIGFGPYAYLNRLVERVCSAYREGAGTAIEVLAPDSWSTGLQIGQGLSNQAIPPELGCSLVLQGTGLSAEPVYVSMDDLETKVEKMMAQASGAKRTSATRKPMPPSPFALEAFAIDFVTGVTGATGANEPLLEKNFIELGLDSMDIADLLDQCNAFGGRKLSLQEAYAASTLGAFLDCYAAGPRAAASTASAGETAALGEPAG